MEKKVVSSTEAAVQVRDQFWQKQMEGQEKILQDKITTTVSMTQL